jgi:hypothetical protein
VSAHTPHPFPADCHRTMLLRAVEYGRRLLYMIKAFLSCDVLLQVVPRRVGPL